jgi:hypothetical protein
MPAVFHKAKYGRMKWNEMPESPTEQEKTALKVQHFLRLSGSGLRVTFKNSI